MNAFVKLSAIPNDIALQDVPQPEVGDTEILVHVQAVGIGIHDGSFFPANIEYPYVIGVEAAGIIAQVGAAVNRFRVGQRVAFVNAMQPKGGTWAEYTVVNQNALIIPIPDSMTFAEAAALPVAGNTALRAFRCLSLSANESLFIAGGSGAIGTLAIQQATHLGYRVIASASADNLDYLRTLGAELAVDYHQENWEEHVLSTFPEGVDAAIAIPPGTSQHSEAIVRSGGMIVTVSGDQFLPDRGIELRQLPYDADVTSELEAMYHKIDTGAMHLTIAQTYPFTDGLAALAKAQARHARGKRVLTMPGD